MPKKRKDDTGLVKATEFATPERARQDGGLTIEAVDRDAKGGVIQVRQKARITCRLDWYKERGTISEPQWQAGCRFAFLHFVAGKYQRITPMYGDFVSGRRGQAGVESKTDAQIRLEGALAALNPSEADVLWDVCGNDQWAYTGRIRSMVSGLEKLAKYFGN